MKKTKPGSRSQCKQVGSNLSSVTSGYMFFDFVSTSARWVELQTGLTGLWWGRDSAQTGQCRARQEHLSQCGDCITVSLFSSITTRLCAR